MKKTLLTLPLFVLGACSGGNAPSPTTQQGLVLSTYTNDEITGQYSDGVVTMQVSSRALGADIALAQISLDDLDFKLTVDYGQGTADFANPSVAVNREQVTALRAFETELGFIDAPGKDLTNVERAIHSAAALLSNAAAGEILPNVHAVSTRSWQSINSGNYCYTLYGTPGYGGSSGGCTVVKQTGRDSDNCKGRCGAGCNTAHSGGYNTWTMDCAEHDYQIGPLGDCVDDTALAPSVYTSGGSCFHSSSCSDADNCGGGHSAYCRN